EGPRVSPFLSRYLMRAAHGDIITSESDCFVYTKLCRIVIIGLVRSERRSDWHRSKLHLKSGHIGGSVDVPGGLFEYWNEKADQSGKAMASLSPQQKKKIAEALAGADPDWLRESEVFRAMRNDVLLSGRDAFKISGGESAPREEDDE